MVDCSRREPLEEARHHKVAGEEGRLEEEVVEEDFDGDLPRAVARRREMLHLHDGSPRRGGGYPPGQPALEPLRQRDHRDGLVISPKGGRHLVQQRIPAIQNGSGKGKAKEGHPQRAAVVPPALLRRADVEAPLNLLRRDVPSAVKARRRHRVGQKRLRGERLDVQPRRHFNPSPQGGERLDELCLGPRPHRSRRRSQLSRPRLHPPPFGPREHVPAAPPREACDPPGGDPVGEGHCRVESAESCRARKAGP
mmetsp:Transcript_45992/g.149451  ORF Transcript_45992/g.149451 Transcript_45992/m.149451 type:complete len:252 (-) Transcript_45992:20-775(-)